MKKNLYLIPVILGLLIGCSSIPQSHTNLDEVQLSKILNKGLTKDERRVNICGGKYFVIGNLLGKRESLGLFSNRTYLISDNFGVIDEINNDEMTILDLPLSFPKLSISYKNPKKDDIPETTVFFDNIKYKNTYIVIDRVVDSRNVECIPISGSVMCSGNYQRSFDILISDNPNDCSEKRIVSYKKIESKK